MTPDILKNCTLCPRKCGVNRTAGQKGFCMSGEKAVVAKTMLHIWEEPPLSGKNGAGAVFFSGCSLRCVFCQNRDISQKNIGREFSAEELAQAFLELQNNGAHNIDLITPTHFVPQITAALDISKSKLHIPVVYNTSGYETVETLKMLENYVDVYLPDFKYFSPDISAKYSCAPDYFEVASKALREMYRQCGVYTEDENGMAKRGIIVRHLVLPGNRHDSIALLKALSDILTPQDIRLSLMSQYTPCFSDGKYPELSRKITTFEYNSVLEYAEKLGFTGFSQDRMSSDRKFTPEFFK